MSKRLNNPGGYGDSAAAALLRRIPDSVERRHLRKLLADLEAQYVLSIDAAATKFDHDNIRAFMLRFLGAAMKAGAGMAGWPGEPSDAELADLAALVEAELGYLEGYAAALEDVRPRSKLYGGAVESAFYRGWLHRLPSDIRIDWKLGVAEHCLGGTGPGPCRGGCVKIQEESPYNLPGMAPNPLPTVPRNGDTFCNANCKCFLVADYGDSRSNTLEPEIGAEVTAQRGGVIDPTSAYGQNLAKPLQPHAELIGYWTRLGRPDQVAHAREALDVTAIALGLTVRQTATIEEILYPVTFAKAAGLRWLNPDRPDDWDLIIGVALAIILPRQGSVAGKLEAWTASPPSVTLDGTRYGLDATGRNLAFVLPLVQP